MDRKIAAAALATLAAALFATSAAMVSTATAADDVTVKCYGANACKGQAECKTSMNSCKGQNACKGKGFIATDEKSCLERFGRS